jgi:MFS family permease
MFKRIDLSDKVRKDLFLFLVAMALLAFSQSVFDTVFNNYLNETFKMSGFRRTFLELPREIPGLLVVFVSAIFFFLSNRRLAAVSQLLTMAGALCIGFVTNTYSFMLVWLLMYSMGQHIFLPLQSDIGMELAGQKGLGRRLGQIYSAVNIAGIAGSAAVFLGFRFLKLDYRASFIVAAVGFLMGAVALFAMSPNKPVAFKDKIFVRKEYA